MPPMCPKYWFERASRNPQPRGSLLRPGWQSEKCQRPVWSYSLGMTAIGPRPIEQRRSQHVDGAAVRCSRQRKVAGASRQPRLIICAFGGVLRVKHPRCRLACVTKRGGGRAARATRNCLNTFSDQTMVVADNNLLNNAAVISITEFLGVLRPPRGAAATSSTVW